MAIGRTRSEVRLKFDWSYLMLGRTGPNLFKIKVRPNWIGLELRYVGPARTEPLNPLSDQQLLQEKWRTASN
jgi:hypothetical protein